VTQASPATLDKDAAAPIEIRSLKVHRNAMLLFAVLGFVAYGISGVAATQLDGVISLINFGAAIIAGRLVLVANEPPTPQDPYGRLALENLYVLFRSLMLLAVVGVAVITNGIKVVTYLVEREAEEPHFGIAAAYTGFVAVGSLLLSWNHRRNNARIQNSSKLLKVEGNAALMEGVISAGICFSLLLITVLPNGTAITSESFNIKAIADSLIVLILCALLFREPLHEARAEFSRLSGRRTDGDLDLLVRDTLNTIIDEYADSNDFELVDVMTVRRGKFSEIDLRVSYSGVLGVAELDAIRSDTLAELQQRIGPVRLFVIFTRHLIHEPPTHD
jgi:predicted Co/Zn/Cd cation transporter (cation efflux family)